MNQKTPDPLSAWQDLIQKWEIEVNEWSGKLTQSDQFSALMGQATKMNLVAQKAWADRMETLLASLNLPSKSDLSDIADRLDAIEDSIAKLRLAIEAGQSPGDTNRSSPEPRRTRKAPRKKE